MERFEARADAQLDDDNVMLTLSGSSWLLNVDASPAEWDEGLPRVPGATSSRRMSVSLGTSAGRPVWWSVNNDQLIVSVGRDVDSWDFVVTLPSGMLSEIQAQLREADGDWS